MEFNTLTPGPACAFQLGRNPRICEVRVNLLVYKTYVKLR